MIYNTCPICSIEAEFHVLGKGKDTVAFIYNCGTHGLFAVTRNLERELRSLSNPLNSTQAHLLRAFSQEVLNQTHLKDGDVTHIPIFERLPS